MYTCTFQSNTAMPMDLVYANFHAIVIGLVFVCLFACSFLLYIYLLTFLILCPPAGACSKVLITLNRPRTASVNTDFSHHDYRSALAV